MAAINKKIGEKIKALRKAVGISQIKLAERVGVSFQQIQKYEKGSSKISVFRLQQIAKALGVNIIHFFETEPTTIGVSDYNQKKYSTAKEVVTAPSRLLTKEEIIILRLFRKIKNKKIRESIRKQLKGIVEIENK